LMDRSYSNSEANETKNGSSVMGNKKRILS
jgi:hypothetical protein